MKILISIILILYSWLCSSAQTRITGIVSGPSGDAVPGANIIIEGTYDGTTTDARGNFEFTSAEQGPHRLIVRFIGYREHAEPITLGGGEILLSVSLREEVSELEAVTISAGDFSASDVSRRTVFRAMDIATTAGATADIAGALNTLPGTQKVGETGRLFVRGGDETETRTFIDGVQVMDAYDATAPNTPSRGRFLPFMFKGTSFSTGGYSAEWGQALSSVLALDSRDEAEMTRTDIGILSVGGDVAHTQAWNRGSGAAKIQYTNLRPYTRLISQELQWKDAPVSVEGVAAFRQKFGRHGIAKIYGNINDSEFSLFTTQPGEPANPFLFSLRNRYRYLNGSARTALSDEWVLRGGISHTAVNNQTRIAGQHGEVDTRGWHFKSVAEGSLSSAVEVKAGAELLSEEYRTDVPATGEKAAFREVISVFFSESEITASRNFVARAGARFEHNSLSGQSAVDPRFSAAYRLGGKGQFSFAWGRFRQSAMSAFRVQNRNLLSERAEHFILNYQYVQNDRTFRVETFLKRYADLVKTNEPLPQNGGDGFARGVELFWRDSRTVQGLDYWVSWSFLDTRRNYLDFPVRAMPSFASAHNLSVVVKYFFRPLKSQAGATYSFASSRPFNNPNSDKFMDGRTPAYHDLSFNWSYLPVPWLIIHFSCTNLTGRDNIFGYEYASSPDSLGVYNGRPIRQPAPRFVFLGVFITLSRDRSVNQLPAL